MDWGKFTEKASKSLQKNIDKKQGDIANNIKQKIRTMSDEQVRTLYMERYERFGSNSQVIDVIEREARRRQI